MSGNNTLTELSQEIIAQYSPELIGYYVQLSAAALVIYDYLLTFSAEITLIWNGRVNLTKALFFVNRYAGLIYMYSIVFLYLYKPASNSYINSVADTFFNIAVYCIFTLRTFAIYGKSWIIFFVLAIPALVDVATNIWSIVVDTASALPLQLQVGPNSCDFNGVNASENFVFNRCLFLQRHPGDLVDTISATLFDVMVIILTIRCTYRLAKASREANIHRSLSYILLRDGTVFYAAIFLPTLINFALDVVVLSESNININLSYATDDFTAMIIAFRNVAVNRLVLSLCHAANSLDDTEYRSQTGIDPPVFASNSVLGNIGGVVHDDFDYLDREEELKTSTEENSTDNKTNLAFQCNFDGVASHAGTGALSSIEEISV